MRLFVLVWRGWLDGARVNHLHGWRDCCYDTADGQRQHVTFEGWPWTGAWNRHCQALGLKQPYDCSAWPWGNV